MKPDVTGIHRCARQLSKRSLARNGRTVEKEKGNKNFCSMKAGRISCQAEILWSCFSYIYPLLSLYLVALKPDPEVAR